MNMMPEMKPIKKINIVNIDGSFFIVSHNKFDNKIIHKVNHCNR